VFPKRKTEPSIRQVRTIKPGSEVQLLVRKRMNTLISFEVHVGLGRFRRFHFGTAGEREQKGQLQFGDAVVLTLEEHISDEERERMMLERPSGNHSYCLPMN